MKINQDFMLLSRRGQTLLGQISGQVQPIQIHEVDIFLLEEFFTDKTLLDGLNKFLANKLVKKLIPNINSSSAKARLQQFEQAGIFASFSNHSLPDCESLSSYLKETHGEIDLPEALRITNNFAVSLSDYGYQVYSNKLKAQVKLPSIYLLVVLAFSAGNKPQAVIEKLCNLVGENIQSIIHALIEHGILVKQSNVTISGQAKTSQQYAELSYPPKIKTWQSLDVDHRIPIYFVPHMENHFPLALGVLYSAIQAHKNGMLLERFQLIPITYMSPNDLFNGPYRKFKTGVWLFSNYMWSVDLNLQVSHAIKQHDSRNITIHGGPSTPDYKLASDQFMRENASVDICVHGEGELAISQILEQIISENDKLTYRQDQLGQVPGITFRNRENMSEHIRTIDRIRMDTPDTIPSPYLNGTFDVYAGRVEAAIIESNRGCPFGCTFCDWGSATNQKVRKLDLDRVKEEIEWIGKNKVRVIWIADANFGLYDRDIELSQFIIDTKAKYGYPQEVVVNYTKNSTWRLVEIIKIFTAGGIISQGIISIQTTDEETLDVINRRNIKTSKYDELVKVFYDLKLPLSTDLMIGLPGITVSAFKNDLQRYIDMDVSVKAYPTQLLPNSPMADPDYIEKYQIKVDKDDFVIASFSFNEKELEHMKGLYSIYTMADGYSLLRYLVRFLQWEHDIRAIDFLEDLREFVLLNPQQYPQITWAVKFFNQDKCMPGGWLTFYQQIKDYLLKQYKIKHSSSLETVLKISEFCMPDDAKHYPLTIELEHDFSAYFAERSSQEKSSYKKLEAFGPAKFHVADPNSMVSIDLDYLQYDSHQYFWELHSDIARPKSVSDFVDAR